MVIPAETFFVFLAGALVLNITPGPDMAFALASSVKGGARSGVAAAIGIGCGSLIWAGATAVGLAALLSASRDGLTILRIAGGCYLVFLAVQTFRHRRDRVDAAGADGAVAAFRAGLVTNLLNPKVGLFYMAFLPAFTNATAGPIWLQVLFLGAVFSVGGACVLIGVAAAAGRLRDRIVSSASLRARIRTASALVFGGLGLHLIFARNP